MKKTKAVVAWNAGELTKAFGLTPADGAKIELQSDLKYQDRGGGRMEGTDTPRGGQTGRHIAHARDSDLESQYEGHFDGSHVASVVRVGVYGKGTV